jgi:hypothetical protein
MGQGFLMFDVSRSHSDTPYVDGGSDLATHNTIKKTDIHSIRTRNPNKRAAEDPLLRPRGHRNRLITLSLGGISFFISLFRSLTPSTYSW